jgi:MFS family permease
VCNGEEHKETTYSKGGTGVFVSSADTSIVFATNGAIASDFEDLENSGWLVTGFMFAMCATQPLVGKPKYYVQMNPFILIASSSMEN